MPKSNSPKVSRPPLRDRLRNAARALVGTGGPMPVQLPQSQAGLSPLEAQQVGLAPTPVPPGFEEANQFAPLLQGYGMFGSPLGTDPFSMSGTEKWAADIPVMGRDTQAQYDAQPRAPKLSPTYKGQSASVVPADLLFAPENPSESERDQVEHIQKCVLSWFKATEKERLKWAQAYRAYEGDQWLTVDNGALVDARSHEEVERSFTINMLFPIVTQTVAALTQNQPDVTILPIVESPGCEKAAEEGTQLYAHAGNLFEDRITIQTLAWHAALCGVGWRILNWSPKKSALVPVPDGMGGIKAASRRVGEIEESDCGPGGVLLDPTAKKVCEAGWAITRHVMPLTWVFEHYGSVGELQPDTHANATDADMLASSSASTTIESSPLFAGWLGLNGSGGKRGEGCDAITVWRYLERPNWRYPRGRHLIMAGGRILHSGIWPYERMDTYPLALLQSGPSTRGIYPTSLAFHCLEAQRVINREWSRILARLDKDKRMLLIQRLSGIDDDAYEEQRDLAKLYYNPNTQRPDVVNMEGFNPQHFEMLDRAYRYMQEISGAVDALQGQNPSGATSAAQLDLLQQAAATKLKPFITGIESLARQTAEWRLALYAQFIKEPRLIGLDDRDNPGSEMPGQYQPLALQALTSSGMVAVRVEPGSALPRSPQAAAADMDADYVAGKFGQPATPETNTIYWTLSRKPYARKALKLIEEQVQQAQEAQQAQIASALEAQQAQAQMQAQQAQAERETQAIVQAEAMAQKQAEQDAKSEQARQAQEAQLQGHAVRALGALELEKQRGLNQAAIAAMSQQSPTQAK